MSEKSADSSGARPVLRPGRCIRFYEETSNKKPFAVVVEIAGSKLLVARGTSNGGHNPRQLIVSRPILPGDLAANQWRPPLDVPTYFYEFHINDHVTLDDVDDEDIGGMCDEDLWNAIRDAAQPRVAKFVRDSIRSRLRRGPRK